MAVKRRRLFLYLAIACFAGLMTVFIVDGYLGIYDTIFVTAREYTQKIEADYWLRQGPEYYPYPQPPRPEGEDETAYCCIGANEGDTIFFRYQIANHQSSTYSTDIQASVWRENEKIVDLFSGDVSIGPFDNETVAWKLSSDDVKTDGIGAGMSRRFTVKINRGDIERKIIIDFYYPEAPPIPQTVPPPELQR